MHKYLIDGNKVLNGSISISGSKNASLPIIAATVLNGNVNKLYNIPQIEDVSNMIKILEELGCKVDRSKDYLKINSNSMNFMNISKGLMKRLRASIILVGPILSKFKEVTFSCPGGCNIGNRPIDLHINNFKKLGIQVKEYNDEIKCTLDNLKSGTIYLDFPSVGATENLIMVSVLGKHEVIIKNSAREPEIVDLANFLNSMGAKIYGAGSSIIKIEGVSDLKETSYKVMPDRIEAGTFVIAFALTRGEGKVENVIPSHINAILNKLKDLGCIISKYNDSIYIRSKKILDSTNIKTLPYPGFPTDLQPIFTVLQLTCSGKSKVNETIFENRYNFINELRKMGAIIQTKKGMLEIEGPQNLSGANVECTDLRGGAAIALAGLIANGKTIIDKIEHIDRGYELFDSKLNKIGANINKIL